VHQSGTDAFVCQPGDLSDSFTASHGRGSDWGFLLVHFYVVHPVSWVGEKRFYRELARLKKERK
jgi:hypothetical protein